MIRGKKGFTLMELIMVIAIIGVLAAIMVPKFSGQRIKADEAAARANLNSLRAALQMYISDNNGVAPAATDIDTYGTGLPPTYIREIPEMNLTHGAGIAPGAEAGTFTADGLGDAFADGTDGGGWYYQYDSANQIYEVYINSGDTPSDGAGSYYDW
ncbi:type IV pilin protein [Candidatus Omnitrophota bacterium]